MQVRCFVARMGAVDPFPPMSAVLEFWGGRRALTQQIEWTTLLAKGGVRSREEASFLLPIEPFLNKVVQGLINRIAIRINDGWMSLGLCVGVCHTDHEFRLPLPERPTKHGMSSVS